MESNTRGAKLHPGVFCRGVDVYVCIYKGRKNKQDFRAADVFNALAVPPSLRCLFALLSKRDLWPSPKNVRGRDSVGRSAPSFTS